MIAKSTLNRLWQNYINFYKSLKYPSLSLPFQLSVSEPQTPLPKSLSLPTFLKDCDNVSKHSGSACYVPGTIFTYRHVTHIDCQACEQNPSWDHATHSQQDLKRLELKHLPRITQPPRAEGGEKMQSARAYCNIIVSYSENKMPAFKKLTKRKRWGVAKSSNSTKDGIHLLQISDSRGCRKDTQEGFPGGHTGI